MSATDLTEVRKLEESMLSCWPAFSTLFDGSWVIRLSGGHTSRANSISVLDPKDDANGRLRLEAASAHFARRGIAPALRVTPLTPPRLVAEAEAMGWQRHKDSFAMTMPVRAVGVPDAPQPAPKPSQQWLNSVAVFMDFSDEKRNAIGKKLALLGAEAGFFTRRDSSRRTVAVLMAALYRDTVGIMDVGVEPRMRREGQATSIVKEALGWAGAKGARQAWLQVAADNDAGRRLYQRLGFKDAYSYWHLGPGPQP